MATRLFSDLTGTPAVQYSDPSPPKAGQVIAFAGATVPSGWLLCDGQEVSQTVYSELFTSISTIYATQTNPTTGAAWAAPAGGNFRVPDLRGLMLRGVGSPSGGTAVTLGGFQDDQMQGHIHSYTSHQGATQANTGGAAYGPTASNTGSPITDGTNGTPRLGTETRGKNRGVNYIIRCFNPTVVSNGTGLATDVKAGLIKSYVESTFTPGFAGTGSATYTSQSGTYTKIGNRVHFDIRIIAIRGTATGTQTIATLPISSAGVTGVSIGEIEFLDYPASTLQLVGFCSGTSIILKFVADNGVQQDFTATALNTSAGTPTTIQISGSYRATT